MSPRAVPVCARKTAAVIIPTPGTVSSRRASGEPRTNWARSPLDSGDLLGEEVDLPQRRIDRVALIGREGLPGEPLAAGSAECVCHRRAVLEVAVQHGEHLVLALRASDDEVRATADSPSCCTRGLVGQPRVLQQPGGEELREQPGVVAVGLLLGLSDRRQPARIDDHHLRDVRPDDPGDRQRVAGRLQRHPIIGPQLLGERGRAGTHPRPACDLSGLPAGDLTEVTVHIQADVASLHPFAPFLDVIDGSRKAGTRH
jgi:hypothetical protein